MKKAKIVLTAIALFAVVGGALAFKAKKFGTGSITFSYATTVNGVPTTLCTRNLNYTTTNLASAPISTYYTTTLPNSVCPTTFFTSRVTTVLP